MKKIQIYVFALSAFIFPVITAHATDYNYLPADVGIKQREALSSLEYQLKSLQSQITNNPTISISTITSRISQLENERDTEINYIRSLYAKNGISNQADSKIAEITAKYSSQISELESQKSQYQTQSNNSAKESEIAELKLKIKQLEYDMQTAEYNKVTETPKKQGTIQDLFDWLESLPSDQAIAQYKLLKSMNPENAYKIELLYRAKYPQSFTNTEQKTVVQTVPSNVQKTTKTSQPTKKAEQMKEEEFNFTKPPVSVLDTATFTPVVDTVKVIELPKKTFTQKIVGFFKKFAFWR